MIRYNHHSHSRDKRTAPGERPKVRSWVNHDRWEGNGDILLIDPDFIFLGVSLALS